MQNLVLKWRELVPLFLRHCHCAIIFYFSATATWATVFSSRQWRGGAKSDANAQHWTLQQQNINLPQFYLVSQSVDLKE